MPNVNEVLTRLVGEGGLPGGSDVARIIQPALQMVQNNGGLQNLMVQLQNSPVAEQAGSWLGSGPNLPVSPDALAGALGMDNVTQIAEQSGLPVERVKTLLAELLPSLVSRLTPGGAMPSLDQVNAMVLSIPGAEQVQGQVSALLGRVIGGGTPKA